jgi:hypothetical protein
VPGSSRSGGVKRGVTVAAPRPPAIVTSRVPGQSTGLPAGVAEHDVTERLAGCAGGAAAIEGDVQWVGAGHEHTSQ